MCIVQLVSVVLVHARSSDKLVLHLNYDVVWEDFSFLYWVANHMRWTGPRSFHEGSIENPGTGMFEFTSLIKRAVACNL